LYILAKSAPHAISLKKGKKPLIFRHFCNIWGQLPTMLAICFTLVYMLSLCLLMYIFVYLLKLKSAVLAGVNNFLHYRSIRFLHPN